VIGAQAAPLDNVEARRKRAAIRKQYAVKQDLNQTPLIHAASVEWLPFARLPRQGPEKDRASYRARNGMRKKLPCMVPLT
jgi:hypothetical protein